MRNFFYGCGNIKRQIIVKINDKKPLFIVLCAVFIIGLLIGLFIKPPPSVRIYYIEYTEIYYFRIFSASSGMFSVFMSRVLNNLFYFTAIYIFSLTVFLMPLNFLIIFYRGFILGTVCVIIFKSYSVNGMILAVLVLTPQNIAITFFMIAAVVIGADRPRGAYCINGAHAAKLLFFELIFLYALSLIGALYELVFTALILRPINFLF